MYSQGMSEDAKSAIIAAAASREGARITGVVSEQTFAELAAAGMVGQKRGLTVRGVVARQKLLAALEAAAF